MRKAASVLIFLAACVLLRSGVEAGAKKNNVPHLPGAVLLVGWPPGDLILTTTSETQTLQEEKGDWYLTPSMSRDGRVIASARIIPSDVPRGRPYMVVATYSVADKKWTQYKGLETLNGSVAISPDGSKLAFLAREMPGVPSHLHALDVKTGKATVGPRIHEYAGTDMSWSPDGRRIVFNMDTNEVPSIHVLDLETGKIARIANGRAPAWSPSGEWIAFLDYPPDYDDRKLGLGAPNSNRVSLIRPDGTDSKVLVSFSRHEVLNVMPVWSPDSRTILINRFRDEQKATMNIYLLDLSTLKLTRKFKGTMPVYGWAEAK